ncbi:olfactory receptor 1019-like [Hippoglossus hippoglossus]|uniref:olfactory receptor 1019-like n=1 Tax=Hippoglossus hippoglossus TaxID=8267 RepID=UPI00148CF3AF|nr:olfactory receptor 1019-like [Hippoglossus hippoglossus]
MMENVSVIKIFYLSGLSEPKNNRFVLFSLTLLCYCVILLVNITLIVTIILDKNLHEPMYILLCAFCMNGLYGTTGFFPKFLWDLLSPVHVISYSGCFLQGLVIHSFACIDLSFLAAMAYDRYVAICRPLQYHTIMSKQRLMKLVCFSWFTPFCIIGTNICITSRLKLCSPYIASLFCVNWLIVALACFPAETMVNNIVAYITILIYVFHGVFIVWSYIYLIRTCVNSVENRAKFMQTCVPHLLSLITFIFTVLFDIMNIRYGSKKLPQSLKNFISMEILVIPPLMNPLIYGFKLTKIRNRFLGYMNFRIK